MLKKFTQVESLASTQSRQMQQLASNIGYHTAPQDQERVGGYQPPPSHASYEPPRHAGQLPAPEATFIFSPSFLSSQLHRYHLQCSKRRQLLHLPPLAQDMWPSMTTLLLMTMRSHSRKVRMEHRPPDNSHYPSLSSGDVITNATVIDDGWMEGLVERTGQFGMLPSNYVERQ